MDISPDKRHKAPKSGPQNDQQQIAARQEHLVQQMLNNTGETIFSNGTSLCVLPFCVLLVTLYPAVNVLVSPVCSAEERKPGSRHNIMSAAHKLSLAPGRPDLIHLRPGKYTFNNSMMPTTPQVKPQLV